MEENRQQLKAALQKGIEQRIAAHQRTRRKRILAGSMALLIPVLVVSFWWYGVSEPVKPIQYFTQSGEYRSVSLKDGSQLTLAGSSAISVTDHPDGSQVELLQGECFFEIEKQYKKPFMVLTNDTRTTVVGTAFTVSKPDSVQPTEIRLKEGVVQISDNHQRQTTLHAGERFFHQPGTASFTVDSVNTEAIGNWKSDRIVWDKMNLRQIKYQLENLLQIRIESSSAVLSQSHQYSLSFNRSISIEDLLEILSVITRKEKLQFEWNKASNQLNIVQ